MKSDQEFTSMNISLPRTQKAFVDRRVAKGGYGSVSDYIRDLIRRDEKDQTREQLEKKLSQALESSASPMTKKDWEDLRDRVLERDRKRKSG